jgi:hypothetical protein
MIDAAQGPPPDHAVTLHGYARQTEAGSARADHRAHRRQA